MLAVSLCEPDCMKYLVYYRFESYGTVFGGHDEVEAESEAEAERHWRTSHPNVTPDYVRAKLEQAVRA
jgi:hypothetical protein